VNELLGQTVVVIGGSAGIGLETARRARAEGAEVVLTGRTPERLQDAARDVDARSTAAFDAHDGAALEQFFQSLPTPIDHVMVTARRASLRGPARWRSRRAEPRPQRASHAGGASVPLCRRQGPARRHAGVHGWYGRSSGRPGLGTVPTVTAALPALIASLALEVAPVRVNLIAPGFVDTPLSASLLGDRLEARRDEVRATLPIGRVVTPADVGALAVHLMVNTALTGATFDIDGGQQLVARSST
jgi:NAD(P)-dependent dehydrogenase (short-subunit alcohol dehydrogenase family)